LVAATLPATAQSTPAGYPIKKCDEPKVPIGLLPKGFGQVSFMVGKDGKPDTASIAVLKVIGLSPAGFRSVAARVLSACHLDMGKPDPSASANVMSEVTFSEATPVQVSTATPLSAPGTALALEPIKIPKDSFPLPLADLRIEERPLRLSCAGPRQQAPQRITARGANAAQAQQDATDQIRVAQQQQAALNSGTLTAQVLVGIDGKPGSQVRVIESSNPMATQNLAELIGGCRFAPGRIHGIAVPAYIETKVP
jgi:hypothetical protein